MNFSFTLPEPELRWNRKTPDVWTLRALFYVQIFGIEIKIQEGFQSDLASIPKPFLRNGTWTPAAIVHDFTYQNAKELSVTREQADKIFLILMLAYDTKIWHALALYTAVRIFGRKRFCGE